MRAEEDMSDLPRPLLLWGYLDGWPYLVCPYLPVCDLHSYRSWWEGTLESSMQGRGWLWLSLSGLEDFQAWSPHFFTCPSQGCTTLQGSLSSCQA